MSALTKQEKTAMDVFSENVKKAMASAGVTQSALSERSGISRPNISRILNGKERVTIDRAERIAKALGKKLSKLLEISKVSA